MTETKARYEAGDGEEHERVGICAECTAAAIVPILASPVAFLEGVGLVLLRVQARDWYRLEAFARALADALDREAAA